MKRVFDDRRPAFGEFGWTWRRRVASPALLNATHAVRPRYIYDAGYEIRHGFWLLEYCATLGVRTRIGSPEAAWRERPQNVGFLYPPGVSFWQDARVAAEPIRVVWVVFDEAKLLDLGRFGAPPFGLAEFADPEGVLRQALEQLAEVAHAQGEAGLLKAQAGLFGVLDLLAGACPEEGAGRWSLRSQEGTLTMEQRAVAYFREHLADAIRLDDVAAHLHLSPSHFSHLYRRRMGESPKRTLMRLRIEEAQRQLLAGFKLEHIAQVTGFCSAFHLSRAFKQHTGESPSAFLAGYQGRPSGAGRS